MEPLARIIAGFFRSWWWGDPLLLPDRTDVVRPAREFVQGGWRDFTWFFFGSGMGRPKPNAESGVGFAISLLGVVLAGTVGLGTAVHKTGSERPGYALFYALAGLPVLGAMASVLRASKFRACETYQMIRRGEGERVKHHFNEATICFTRWTLGTCLVLYALSAALALSGFFPGQSVIGPTVLPLVNVEPCKWDKGEYEGKAGLTVEYAIGEEAFPNGNPRRLRVRAKLVGELAEGWVITDVRNAELRKRASPSGKFEAISPCPYPDELDRPNVKGLWLVDLDAGTEYRLDIHLAAKKSGTKADEGITLIRDRHQIAVFQDEVPVELFFESRIPWLMLLSPARARCSPSPRLHPIRVPAAWG